MAEVDTVDVKDAAAATQTVATISKLIKTVGLPADAKSTATDTTSVTGISIWKQISASVQALVTGLMTFESGRAPVNSIPGQAGVAGGSGANGATVQRVTVATDDAMLASVRSPGLAASVTQTRPTNTTGLTAGDLVGTGSGASAAAAAMDFNLGAVSASSIQINSVSLERDVTALISGETSYNLHLYSVTPPSALLDNDPFDLPVGDRASYLGVINLGTPVDWGSTLYIEQNSIGKVLRLAGTHIFGYLQTVGAYTPASGQVHKVTINAIQL